MEDLSSEEEKDVFFSVEDVARVGAVLADESAELVWSTFLCMLASAHVSLAIRPHASVPCSRCATSAAPKPLTLSWAVRSSLSGEVCGVSRCMQACAAPATS